MRQFVHTPLTKKKKRKKKNTLNSSVIRLRLNTI
jgi:hypothetical protein